MQPVTRITLLGCRLGVVILTLYWLTIFIGTHLPGRTVALGPPVNDKQVHFGAYFCLGLLLCYVTTSRRLGRRFGTIFLVGLSYAAIDEFTQSFVPGRSADFRDFAADSAGLLTAIALYAGARRLFRHWTAGRPAAS